MIEITRILQRAHEGQTGASEELAALVYEELKSLARRELSGERCDHTLQPTALVHEAYLRLFAGEVESFDNRAHFFASAATAIRRVLVDHARARRRIKRGGDRDRVPLAHLDPIARARDRELIALDDSLERLAELDPRKARIVELRFFAGMTHEEVARLLEISQVTVQREWRLARAWLRDELEPPE